MHSTELCHKLRGYAPETGPVRLSIGRCSDVPARTFAKKLILERFWANTERFGPTKAPPVIGVLHEENPEIPRRHGLKVWHIFPHANSRERVTVEGREGVCTKKRLPTCMARLCGNRSSVAAANGGADIMAVSPTPCPATACRRSLPASAKWSGAPQNVATQGVRAKEPQLSIYAAPFCFALSMLPSPCSNVGRGKASSHQRRGGLRGLLRQQGRGRGMVVSFR